MPKTSTRAQSTAAVAAALRTVSLPQIGAAWPGQGGIFAGILKGKDGDYAVIVPVDPASDIDAAPWTDAVAKANKFKTSQHSDYTADNRGELALCFHNVPELFKKEWYWSSTPYAGYESYAWYQHFSYGHQYGNRKDYQLRARAVRRVKI